MRRYGSAWFMLAVFFLPASVSAQADREPSEEYERLVGAAVQEFNASQWVEARALFRQAHEISPNARTFRGLGLTSFELGDYVRALRAFRAAAADPRRPLSARQRTGIERLIERALRFVGVFEVEMPELASITVDERPIEAEPDGSIVLGLGAHVFVVSRAGRESERQVVHVEGGERRSLRFGADALAVPLETQEPSDPVIASSAGASAQSGEPAPSSGPDTGWLVVSGALVVVALVGLVVTIERQLLVSRCDELMSSSEPRGVCTDFAAVEAERNLGIGFAAGGALLATGALLAALLLPPSERTETAGWTCSLSPLGATCAGRF